MFPVIWHRPRTKDAAVELLNAVAPHETLYNNHSNIQHFEQNPLKFQSIFSPASSHNWETSDFVLRTAWKYNKWIFLKTW